MATMAPQAATAATAAHATLHLGPLHWQWDDGSRLFDGLQARLGPGLHWLQGDSGSGKTALLRWLAGENLPGAAVQGRAWLAPGADAGLGAGPEAQACSAWLDPRDPAFDALTPAALRDLLARRHPRLDASAWQHHITGFALAAHDFKTLHMLSTGMRRKAALAALLASGAPLLLLDEPCAGLDAPSIAHLVQALHGLVAAEAAPVVLLAAGAWPPGLRCDGSLALAPG